MPDPLHCLDVGSGRPVFLLHAFPLSHTMWQQQVHALGPRYRLIAPDAFGFGKTPPTPTAWSLADLASAVIAAADSLGLTSFTVVGLSMGGYAAFELWRQAPDRIDGLVLANTRAHADTAEERRGRNQLILAVEREGVGLLADRMLRRLLAAAASVELVERVRREIHQTNPSVVGQALAALGNRKDSTEILASINCPTLVIAGAEDAITDASEAKEWAGKIQGSRYVEIPDAGHLSNLEDPTAFNAALGRFLEERA